MSERKIKVACVQLRSGEDVRENIRIASELIREAHKGGARFIATPENTTLMAADGGAKLEKSFTEDRDPAVPAFAALASELDIWLLAGSLAIKVPDGKTANRSYLFGPDGQVEARYDKIHLFDVDLPSGERYRESNTVAPGAAAGCRDSPLGTARPDGVLRFALSPACTGRWRKRARKSSPCRRRLPKPRARHTGTCCCDRAPSRMAALSWRRHKAARIRTAVRHMVTA